MPQIEKQKSTEKDNENNTDPDDQITENESKPNDEVTSLKTFLCNISFNDLMTCFSVQLKGYKK